MSFHMIGFNYSKEYNFPLSVTEGLDGLKLEEVDEYYKIITADEGVNTFEGRTTFGG